MNRDVKNFVDSCNQRQRTGAPSFRNHWPLTPIIPLAPFEKWGIDFIGPISPVSSQKKRYIILATDYTTKWVEARATRKNDAQTSASFLFEEIMMKRNALSQRRNCGFDHKVSYQTPEDHPLESEGERIDGTS
jgi:hypothetical protein